MKPERLKLSRYVPGSHGLITLTFQESKRFVRAILNPPTTNLALQKAAERHREFFDQDDKL